MQRLTRFALLFLSTPSARRATSVWFPSGLALRISIHALREEGDGQNPAILVKEIKFLSTPSARRATVKQTTGEGTITISIHALREEGDSAGLSAGYQAG